jgi:putative transposase
MPRPPRLVIPGMPMHVIQRGNNRDATFRVPSDYMRYRDILHAASQRSRCAIHAYVLMTNHVHMLLTPEEDDGPSRMMQLIGSRYVPYVNSRIPRTGTLWEGRYRSSLVNSDRYLFTCSRYIELNPVRARMTDDPGHYLWSSYLHNARGVHDPLITPHDLYRGLGTEPAGRQAAYRALFEDVLKPEALDAIRQAANTGDLLGDDGFRQKVEASLHRSLPQRHHGGDRRSDTFQACRSTGYSSAVLTFQGL